MKERKKEKKERKKERRTTNMSDGRERFPKGALDQKSFPFAIVGLQRRREEEDILLDKLLHFLSFSPTLPNDRKAADN